MGCAAGGLTGNPYHLQQRVQPVAETAPVFSMFDSADDPAIWISEDEPARSLIIGTDKRSGIYVYALDGSQRQYLPLGNTNNVDLRSAPWGDDSLSVVAASGRFPSELLLLSLDHASGRLQFEKRYSVRLEEPYGICLYRDPMGRPFVFMNSTDGQFAQYSVTPRFEISLVRRFTFDSQVEGCVVDDEAGFLYVAEEHRGIWRMRIAPGADRRRELVDSVRGGHLVADIEGLALYHGPRKLLIASSQGDNSYAVYDADSFEHLLSFHVSGNERVDGTSDTDGLEVTAAALPGFPDGMLVVQDGDNTDPAANQNFKIVSWTDVAALIGR
ncbi:MAG: phytase [Woeseiaceae bacterium]|nr:phytase [Woeseiaceae bacterium]